MKYLPRFAFTLPLALAFAACSGSGGGPGAEADNAGGETSDGGSGGDDNSGGSGPNPGTGGVGGANVPVVMGPVIEGEGPNGFACAPQSSPVSPGMRRLTQVQYVNTLTDLLTAVVGPAAKAIMATAAADLRLFPSDARPPQPKDKHGAYRRMDQDLQDLHLEATYRVAFTVANELVKGANLGMLLGSCGTDADAGNDAECVNKLIDRFSALAFRRPLDKDEAEFFRGFYTGASGISAKTLAESLAGILMAPRFLYQVENGASKLDGRTNVYALDAHEVASRLSYQLWQTMPDKALIEAAAAGELAEEAGLAKQVDRMLADPRARTTFDEFYADYLKVDDLPFIDKTEEFKYRSFAGSDLPGPATRANVIEDVLALTRYLTWTAPDKYAALLTDEHIFAKTDDVARLYKVDKWSGSGEPRKFPSGARPGVLTRVALLATGMVVSRPIMKGVFIRHNLLCDEVPPPPDNAQNAVISQGVATTRAMVERLTQQAGSSCTGCHSALINPLGFATEGFDSLGRARTEEIFYSGDSGLETRRFPVNTSVVPRVTSDDMRPASGPAELAKLIVESGKGEACFARHVFRFTFGRWESLGDDDAPSPADGCFLERVRKVAATKPLRDVIKEAALAPEFRQRTINP